MHKQRKTVLVVDDEPQLLLLLKATVTRGPYAVLTASDGEEALALAKAHHPDVVLLDGNIPLLSGFEVCRRLKSDPRTRDIVVIMLTAKAEQQDRERGFAAGADDYITKPFSPRELLQRLERQFAV